MAEANTTGSYTNSVPAPATSFPAPAISISVPAEDRISTYLPPEDMPALRDRMSQDELWVLALLRQVKEHGYGKIEIMVDQGKVAFLDSTERRRYPDRLALSMGSV